MKPQTKLFNGWQYKSKLLIIIFSSLVLLPFERVSGQNFSDLSNYMSFKPLINTAANGEYENFAGILTGRKQWTGIDGAPASLGVQIVKPFYNYAIGGSIMQETIGVHSLQRFILNYSYTLTLPSHNKLSFGLGTGGIVLTSNFAEVNPTDWNDDQFNGIKTIVRPDFNFGVYLSGKTYFAGLSVPKIVESSIINKNGNLEGNSDYDPLLWTYLIAGGYYLKLDEDLRLTMATLAKINLNAPVELDVNLSLNAEKYSVGISYRTKREALVFFDLDVTDEIKLGYSYHSYFNIQNSYLAGHEIYLIYQYQPRETYRYQSPRL